MSKNGDEVLLNIKERHNMILTLLQQEGAVPVAKLAVQFKVSEVTIRKDLSLLEQDKKLYRAHGCAILMSPYIGDRHVNEKEKRSIHEKQVIAKRAAQLISNNDSIIIGSGTTMSFFAGAIEPNGDMTVITSSLNVTSMLSQSKGIDVIQLGGIARSSSLSIVGPFAEQMLRHFSCNTLFLGVDGIDLEFGLTTTNLLEASLNEVMIKSAQKVVILADSSKFGRRGFSKICDFDVVDVIITDDKAPEHSVEKLRKMGVEVIVVKG